MTKKLIWRLKEQPTSKALALLVDSEILTREDAKQIILSSEENNTKALKEEIEFLKRLVRDLSRNNIQIVEVVKTLEQPYRTSPWYEPYHKWEVLCSKTENGTMCKTDGGGTLSVNSFTNIKTF